MLILAVLGLALVLLKSWVPRAPQVLGLALGSRLALILLKSFYWEVSLGLGLSL